MKQTAILSIVAALALAGAAQAAGRVILVPQEYAGIQAAIDASQEGDTIIAGPGTYREAISFGGRNIVVRSNDPNDPAVVATTILIAPPTGPRGTSAGVPIVSFVNGEGPAAVLTGFTITGGSGMKLQDSPPVYGGGAIVCAGASPTITLNIIADNALPVGTGTLVLETYGGGIGCFESSAVITRNVIRGNSAYAGGGVFVQGGTPRITNNLIYNNAADIAGGVCLVYGGDVINNTIADNEADTASCIYTVSVETGRPHRIINNIICNPSEGEGLSGEGYQPGDLVAFNNIWSSVSGANLILVRGKDPFGNISADPMFVAEALNDYRLQMDSPCINAGDPEWPNGASLDAYGSARIVHSRTDIGAAEYSGNLRPVAKIAPVPAMKDLPDLVTADGSASYDPDGNTQLTYRWTQVRGPEVVLTGADQPVLQFSPGTYGVFAFELVVSDRTVESLPAQVELVVGQGHIPVAEAGLPRYVTTGPVTLNGSASTDPDASGPLAYSWKQISGPTLTVTDANTAKPTVSGFMRTDLPQWCRFELVVDDGQYSSRPDPVDVVILPAVTGINLRQENEPFDANKPTIVYFGGGDCITGSGSWASAPWAARANIISGTYSPDRRTGQMRYDRCGDALLAYLAQVAPDYRLPIQTMGHSTGGQPAIDVARYLNLMYHDARYAVNRVTFLDGRCRSYTSSIADYLASAVDGEQCWVDTYEGTGPYFYPSILNVQVALNDHGFPPTWYKQSLTLASMSQFNHGAVGGYYWSVVGPGKNLQLASTPGAIAYQFRWVVSGAVEGMQMFDEARFPGRLPEPVALIGPLPAEGATMLTCEPSENAVIYQLLIGSDPYRVMDFNVVAETPGPPDAVITELPFARSWWTVRVYDTCGSSIYADPMPVTAFSLSLPVENVTKGQKYGFIQQAIDAADAGDEIMLQAGTYEESVDFRGKSLTLRSTDPDQSSLTAATVIRGTDTVVTVSGTKAGGMLAGLTITGGKRGVLCSGAHPAISRCRIVGNQEAGIDLYEGANPTISNCLIVENGGDGIAMFANAAGRVTKYNLPTLTNCTIACNGKAGISAGKPTLSSCIVYFNGSSIAGTSAQATYSDIQGGWAGEGNIDADPQFAGAGDYHLQSTAGRWDPAGQDWVTDPISSPCIDAGDPKLPVADEPAPNGGRINMGAHGGTAEASKSPGK